jgi:hypothetical protein
LTTTLGHALQVGDRKERLGFLRRRSVLARVTHCRQLVLLAMIFAQTPSFVSQLFLCGAGTGQIAPIRLLGGVFVF